MRIEARLTDLGLVVPEPVKQPAGVRIPFEFVRMRGHRADPAGPATPPGPRWVDCLPARKGGERRVTGGGPPGGPAHRPVHDRQPEARALGDLDRVTAWLRVFGMVTTAPDFVGDPGVVNGCSALIHELWGPVAGQPARSVVGLAGLPFGTPLGDRGRGRDRRRTRSPGGSGGGGDPGLTAG